MNDETTKNEIEQDTASTAGTTAGPATWAAGLAALAVVVVLALSAGGKTAGDTTAGDTANTAATVQVASATEVVDGQKESKPTERAAAAVEAVRAGFTDAQRTEIEQIVRSYLLKNPEILVEVTEELERRRNVAEAERNKKLIVSRKDAIYRSDLDYVYGNPDGDIGVVEFFDYNCSWCKRALDQVQQLTKADENVRVVMKEFPIFGEHSLFAAKAAMAAKKQDKYWPLHVALMKERRVTKDNVLKIAAREGLDVEKLKADMDDPAIGKAIRETQALAEQLGITGTPGFLVDAKVQVGFVPAPQLKALVDEARKTGCLTC